MINNLKTKAQIILIIIFYILLFQINNKETSFNKEILKEENLKNEDIDNISKKVEYLKSKLEELNEKVNNKEKENHLNLIQNEEITEFNEEKFFQNFKIISSITLDFIPTIRIIKCTIEVITGKDYITGKNLSSYDRLISLLVPIIPVFKYIKTIINVNSILKNPSNFSKIVVKNDNSFDLTIAFKKSLKLIFKNLFGNNLKNIATNLNKLLE